MNAPAAWLGLTPHLTHKLRPYPAMPTSKNNARQQHSHCLFSPRFPLQCSLLQETSQCRPQRTCHLIPQLPDSPRGRSHTWWSQLSLDPVNWHSLLTAIEPHCTRELLIKMRANLITLVRITDVLLLHGAEWDGPMETSKRWFLLLWRDSSKQGETMTPHQGLYYFLPLLQTSINSRLGQLEGFLRTWRPSPGDLSHTSRPELRQRYKDTVDCKV